MMYTDQNHLCINDPGTVEGNPVFAYLDAFDPDKQKLHELKEHYRRGGLGNASVKQRLLEVLLSVLDPIRARRQEFATDTAEVMRVLERGSEIAREPATATLAEVRMSMQLQYFDSA